MKTPPFSYVIVALAAMIAFLIGRFTAERSEARPLAGGVNGRGVTIVHGEGPPAPPVALTEMHPTRTVLSAEQARIRTFEVLLVPNRIERMQQLCELLSKVTAENWRDVIDGFVRQTANTGRKYPDEWRLICDKIAQVAGADGIQEALSGSSPDRASLLLAGWAAGDSKAARKWFEAQLPETQSLLAPQLINGIAQSDPVAALSLGVQFDILHGNAMGEFVDGVIQRGGFRAADELLSATIARGEVPLNMQGLVFYTIGLKQIENARLQGQPTAVLEWVDNTQNRKVMGPSILRQLVTFVAQTDAPATLAWIEARNEEWSPELHAGGVWPAIATAMQAQAPEQFGAWMDAHPDHPQRDQMASALAQQLAQRGDFQQARRWSQLIHDAAMRASVEKRLQAPNVILERP